MCMKKLLIVLGLFLTSSVYAGDKVIISGYENYPAPSGCIGKDSNKGGCVLLPNGTLGEVLEWDGRYIKEDKSIYAQIDMFTKSKVSILSGPAKGKVLYIDHIYLTLKN